MFDPSAIQTTLERLGLAETVEQQKKRISADAKNRKADPGQAEQHDRDAKHEAERKDREKRAKALTDARFAVFSALRDTVRHGVDLPLWRSIVRAIVSHSPYATNELRRLWPNVKKTMSFGNVVNDLDEVQLMLLVLDLSLGRDLAIDSWRLQDKSFKPFEQPTCPVSAGLPVREFKPLRAGRYDQVMREIESWRLC